MQMDQEPIQIQVDMEVTRYEEYPDDGFVQVFGFVGDYGISVCLPIKDKRVQKIKRQGNPDDHSRKA